MIVTSKSTKLILFLFGFIFVLLSEYKINKKPNLRLTVTFNQV